MKRAFNILTTIVLLAACSPGAGIVSAGIPTVVPSATPAPSPTATVTPIPTGTPTLTVTPEPRCLRIMPLGDSITVGVPDTDHGGYRNLLGTLLKNDGLIFDFVGSQQTRIGVIPDSDNEGHSGWKIFNIKDGIDSQGWLETYRPNLILIHLGTNDIIRGHGSEAPANLSVLLDDILFRLPETHIIVAQIIPFSSGPTEQHISLNAAISDIVAARAPRVSMVDMQNILSHDDYADTYHPNEQGYAKMARAWEAAILALDLESLVTPSCETLP